MLDTGCTQHITSDPSMFSSLEENVVGYSDIIFGDNSQGKVEGVDKLLSQMITLSLKCVAS